MGFYGGFYDLLCKIYFRLSIGDSTMGFLQGILLGILHPVAQEFLQGILWRIIQGILWGILYLVPQEILWWILQGILQSVPKTVCRGF